MQRLIHPLHAACLAGTVPLFLGGLLNDVAYFMTYEVQWKNFASWLIVGGLVFGGFALLGFLLESLRARPRVPSHALYPLLLFAMWILGFVNAFVHAGDAWASMPTGLILSVLVAMLAIAATGVRFYGAYSRAAA